MKGAGKKPLAITKPLAIKAEDKPEVLVYKGRTQTIKQFAEIIKRGPQPLGQEYIAMREEVKQLLQVATIFGFQTNKQRNRYFDTPILDKTRIRLKDGLGTDYINASYIQNSSGRSYICASGPLDTTVTDFWRMIWQEKVVIIVMLCRPVEEGKDKCAQYWSDKEGTTVTFDGFSIETGKQWTRAESITETYLRITPPSEKFGPPRAILHVGFYEWPDQGQPECESSLCALQDLIERRFAALPTYGINALDPKEVKIVVHCSAGIGRTGTLMAFCIAVECIRNSGSPVQVPDLSDVVRHVRSQRPFSVQTPGQYLFVHTAVSEYLIQNKHTTAAELGLDPFKATVKDLMEQVAARKAQKTQY